MNEPTQFFIISEIIKQCSYTSYLEIGIRDGINFNSIASLPSIRRATAVDIDNNIPVINSDIVSKYICTSDDFFATNKKTFDVIFIDADHNIESVKRDLLNSLDILNPLGTVFLHDTDPRDKELLHEHKCSNSYLINGYLKRRSDLMFVTLPVHIEGVTIVRRSEFRYGKFL